MWQSNLETTLLQANSRKFTWTGLVEEIVFPLVASPSRSPKEKLINFCGPGVVFFPENVSHVGDHSSLLV